MLHPDTVNMKKKYLHYESQKYHTKWNKHLKRNNALGKGKTFTEIVLYPKTNSIRKYITIYPFISTSVFRHKRQKKNEQTTSNHPTKL